MRLRRVRLFYPPPLTMQRGEESQIFVLTGGESQPFHFFLLSSSPLLLQPGGDFGNGIAYFKNEFLHG